MHTIEEIENEGLNINGTELILFLMTMNIIERGNSCNLCGTPMKIAKHEKNIDGTAWRCYKKSCTKFHTYQYT